MIGSIEGSAIRQRVQYSSPSEKQVPEVDKQPEEVVWGKTPAGVGQAFLRFARTNMSAYRACILAFDT